MPNHIHGIIIIKKIAAKMQGNIIVNTPCGNGDNNIVDDIIIIDTPRGGVFLRGENNNIPNNSITVETPRRDVSTKTGTGIPNWKPNCLGAILNQFKSKCTKRIWAAGFHDFKWQPGFHDHIIRNEKSFNLIKEYIINNPAKWNLDDNNPQNKNIKAD